MKRLVREGIGFTRGSTPKETLGLGIGDPYVESSFAPYVIRELPKILGTHRIPEDILKYGGYINSEYAEVINDWAIEGWGIDFLRTVTWGYHYNLWSSLKDRLEKMGYKI